MVDIWVGSGVRGRVCNMHGMRSHHRVRDVV